MSKDGLIFYEREALGKNGTKINIFKFRTMERGSHEKLCNLVLEFGIGAYGKIENDPRITPLGKILRKYWLDELPQIPQVLFGQMSIVGIRPGSEEDWSTCPEELKREALKHKPGFFGVNYAYITNSFRAKLFTEFLYLEEKKEAPIKTDFKYFAMITYNILFKGLRSK